MRISDWSSDVCSSDLEMIARSAVDDAQDGETTIPAQVAGFEGRERQHLDQLLAHVPARDQQCAGLGVARGLQLQREIGRASCRERVCQYVSISVGAVSLKKKTHP